MKKRALEILLHSVNIPVTGTSLEKKTSHLLGLELIWPRVGTAKKSSNQSIKLNKGMADFDEVHWGRRILMRENVEGRFAMGLTLTENLDYEELEKFLRFWAKAVLDVTAHAVDKAAGPLGDLAAAPLEYAAKAVAKYPGAALLAEGMVEIDADEFPPPGDSRLLTIRMTAAQKMVRVTRRTVNSKQPARTTRKVLLSKGDDNGEVTLLIKSL